MNGPRPAAALLSPLRRLLPVTAGNSAPRVGGCADGNRPRWALRAGRRPAPTQEAFWPAGPATGRRPL